MPIRNWEMEIKIILASTQYSPGQEVDRGPPVDREIILGGPPVLQERG
jgi:hypothetical protein